MGVPLQLSSGVRWTRALSSTVPRSFIVYAPAIAILVLACDAASPKHRTAIDLQAAGCYALEWPADAQSQRPRFRADTIRLDTTLRAGGPVGPDSLNRTLEPVGTERPKDADTRWSTAGLPVRAWKPIRPDSVALVMIGWGAEVVWSFRLHVSKDSLDGTARFDTDVVGNAFMTTVVARRVPCGRDS
jgi:hypothetical protein